MFVPDDQRGGGEGGDGDGKSIIFIDVPMLDSVEFVGNGEHHVLLVLVRFDICTCPTKITIEHASRVLSEVTKTCREKVEKVLKESLKDIARKDVRSGEGEYIKSLVWILSLLFCENQFTFSSEKIN